MSPIHVVGAGGIGCAVGHALCWAGADVTFIDADQDKVAWGREHGVGIDGRPPFPATFTHFDDWFPPEDALVILCTKCYDNAAVLARVPSGATIVPIQNGFDLSPRLRAPGLEGIASFISECHPRQTQTRITRRGRLHLGFREKTTDPTLDRTLTELAERIAPHAAFRLAVVPEILPYKYTKLMYNAAISPLASAAGIDNGKLLSHGPARRLFFGLIRENFRILSGAGVPLAKIGLFHPVNVDRILAHGFIARALAWAFYPSLRKTYCSMALDLPAGRTEIDYYNRHLIELAGKQPCPLNRSVYALVKRMEMERAPPRVEMLTELEALAA